ncbi:retron system putative HNH endonuclease [Paratractidigestivibacter sp.]|uniref:retron system putative HNH endonuclease n=1 Tax=Paratractidigestivibacter sp. TaxID=2847316 RepID=UPI002AC9D74D|nr:retron system putative HNH endonuclease [Paratractidigestivibacter sp.]
MIPINKREKPKVLTDALHELRSTPSAVVCWGEVRNQRPIREALCREQGGLCAYCMRRIDPDSSHVEHIIPQSACEPGQDVAYDNMLAVCDGNEGAGDGSALICDRARRDRALVVNPLKPETLRGIKYYGNGKIDSDDEAVRKDLNETLNLNCEAAYLPQNRKAAIEALNEWMKSSASRRSIVSACKKRRDGIEESELKPEYAGALLYFLDRRIRRG